MLLSPSTYTCWPNVLLIEMSLLGYNENKSRDYSDIDFRETRRRIILRSVILWKRPCLVELKTDIDGNCSQTAELSKEVD